MADKRICELGATVAAIFLELLNMYGKRLHIKTIKLFQGDVFVERKIRTWRSANISFYCDENN
jgi:CII-binding regulator of phage lambda lysogenization HflD